VKTILILDNDLGFAFWLGQALCEIRHNALPAKTVKDAIELLSELKCEPDLLVANPALPGLDTFIAHLRRARELKVIVAVESEEQKGNLREIDCYLYKSFSRDEATRLVWLEKIQSLLA
jgi:DNA-binding response OmpR family regulator